MVDQRDSLLREVDEELRREQFLRLWNQYGIYVVAVAVLIIGGIGGYNYYDHWRAEAAAAAGARFAIAARDLAQNKQPEARKTLEEIAGSGPGGYAALAGLRLAAADHAAGKTAEAASAYEAIAKRGGVDPLIADFAKLQAAMLRLDSADWTDMQNRLNDLAVDNNAWRFSARELLGVAAHKAGKTEEAREQFQKLLADRGTPNGISDRARVMLAMLTEAELAKAAPPPAATEAPPASANKPEPASDDKTKAKAPDKKSK